jgi:hypothetical protein
MLLKRKETYPRGVSLLKSKENFFSCDSFRLGSQKGLFLGWLPGSFFRGISAQDQSESDVKIFAQEPSPVGA